MFDVDTQNRFWSRVDRKSDDDCWPWLGGKNSAGYGVFYPARSPVLATRYACSIPTRQMPAREIYCLHSCDNPICCNPKHLRWGTPTDNVHDAISRRRHKMPPANAHYRVNNAPKGEAVWNHTLTEATVRRIWSLHLARQNHTKISETLGIPVHVIADVCRGRSWRHLSGAPSVAELKAGGVRRDKLTPDDIDTAKALLAEGWSVKAIAARFNVSPTPISNLKNHGKTWVPKPT